MKTLLSTLTLVSVRLFKDTKTSDPKPKRISIMPVKAKLSISSELDLRTGWLR